MAAQRGMTERDYCATYTWRAFKVHVSAYYKDRFQVLGQLGEMLGGAFSGGTMGDNASATTAPRRQPYAWFKRKPGKRYTFIDLDGPLAGVKMVAQKAADWQAKKRERVR